MKQGILYLSPAFIYAFSNFFALSSISVYIDGLSLYISNVLIPAVIAMGLPDKVPA